jgi:ubiquinone/menaquinone biosynthesis C-methylase UbiE
MKVKSILQEKAEKAFDNQSVVFDSLYKGNDIIEYKRQRVRQHIVNYLQNESNILELNCGTGEDALFFASLGHRVHATDISEGMLSILSQKMERNNEKLSISFEKCSYNNLVELTNKGPYDFIFSNFGGLNCTGQLQEVLKMVDSLLKPGGTVCLVIISKFCFWETLLLLRGKFKTAFRRFFASKGRKAHIEGVYFNCWYYSPSFIQKNLKGYKLIDLEGLCTIVPPSYIDGFNLKYPRLFNYLKKKEDTYKRSWPWRVTGDYFIISLQKS